MAEAIKEGDLVMIVRRAPCGCQFTLGKVFIVAAVEMSPELICRRCHIPRKVVELTALASSGNWVELSRLKRINPPALTESTTTDEKVSA